MEASLRKLKQRIQKSVENNRKATQDKKMTAVKLQTMFQPKFGNVTEFHEKKQHDTLNQYIHSFNAREKKLAKFSREQTKKQKEKVMKHQMQLQQVKQNQVHNTLDQSENFATILQKHETLNRNALQSQEMKVREARLRKERDELRFSDTKKNQERQKWQKNMQKLKIFEKHMRI